MPRLALTTGSCRSTNKTAVDRRSTVVPVCRSKPAFDATKGQEPGNKKSG
jgi:hypothetical protein